MAYTPDPLDKTALMTANDAPSPNVASSSGAYNSGSEAWYAFNHDQPGFWDSAMGAFPKWLKYDFGSALYVITGYNILPYVGEAPIDFVLQGSNDDLNWVDFDTQADVTGWDDNTVKTFSFSNSTAYRYIRLYITEAQHALYCGIRELELLRNPLTTEVDIAAEAGINADFDGFRLSDELAAVAGVQAEFDGIKMGDDLAAEAGIKAEFSAAGSIYSKSMSGNAGVNAAFTRSTEALRDVSAEAGMSADFDGFNWSSFLRIYRDRIGIRYILTLRQTGMDDLVVPISSFQTRLRTGDPTYLSVVVPGNDQYDAIAARDDAEMILTMEYVIDGTVYHYEEVCTVDLEDVRLDQGSTSVSVTLSGHRTVTHSAKIVSLTGQSYKAVYDGKIRYRCTPDLYLRPGDTCIIGDDTFVAGVITWMANPSYQTLEIEEA